jgi:hypothetical protein
MAPRLVIIRWTDAQADLGWMDASSARVENPPVWSVGWVQVETKTAIVIAADMGQDGSNNRRIEIPRKMINEIAEMEVETRKEMVKMAKKKGTPKKKVGPKKKVKK